MKTPIFYYYQEDDNSNASFCKYCRLLILCGLMYVMSTSMVAKDRDARFLFSEITLAEKEQQSNLIDEISKIGDPIIAKLYNSWKKGEIYQVQQNGNIKVVRLREDQKWNLVKTGEIISLTDQEKTSLKKRRPSRSVRKLFQRIIDSLGLKSTDPAVRIESALKMGKSQKNDFIAILEQAQEIEKEDKVRKVIEESIAISQLANGDKSQKIKAVNELLSFKSIASRGFLEKLLEKSEKDSELFFAIQNTLEEIEKHTKRVAFFGSFFRGFSTGSVLLIVSFGLAITFGLMGIINMAHGEFVAIGGYVTFLLQSFFISTFGINSSLFGWYWVVSLPLSFVVAAGIGWLIEKSIIRFLYHRPLESLLCTWGLSMVMQQGFRLIFGAANVPINNPPWLMGNLSFGDFTMNYTRLTVIGIALLVVVLTALLLLKTHLGLHIRAVMQNRNMSSCLGISVARVNSMTFALGCGLAGLGGCALSQIGNVGALMGQQYIVDSFMVVVIGSVGNLVGAGFSALGIGLVDQLLQPALGPVMGKITVFFVIILFLQWRPGGLFPTRSRSLED